MISESEATTPFFVPLSFVPRYQMGVVLSERRAWVWWFEVSKSRFFDSLRRRGFLSANSNPDDATALYATGMVLRDGRVLFRVVKG